MIQIIYMYLKTCSNKLRLQEIIKINYPRKNHFKSKNCLKNFWNNQVKSKVKKIY